MLKRTKPPNKYSLKKIAQLNGEKKARIVLCKRAGGMPVVQGELVRRNDGTKYIIHRVICVGGICECGCGRKATPFTGWLHPHETPRRSKGGKVSLRQSKMILNECHYRLDGRQPKLQWLKGG